MTKTDSGDWRDHEQVRKWASAIAEELNTVRGPQLCHRCAGPEDLSVVGSPKSQQLGTTPGGSGAA